MLQPKPRFLETSEGPEFLKYDANHENKVILSSYAGDSSSIPRLNYNFFLRYPWEVWLLYLFSPPP